MNIEMNYNVPLRNTIMAPSRASGTKQIKLVDALAVVEALETTARATGTKKNNGG
jgi:hypothetical protein